MADGKSQRRSFSPKGLLAVVLVVTAFALIALLATPMLKKTPGPAPAPPPVQSPAQEPVAAPAPPVIDYNKLAGQTEPKDERLTALMEERKAKYGVTDSLDMIVTPEESIKVGDHTISMKKILDDVRISQGEIVEDEIPQASPAPAAPPGAPGPGAGAAALDLAPPSPSRAESAPVQPGYDPGRQDGSSADSQPQLSREVAEALAMEGEAAAPPLPRPARQGNEFGIHVVQPGDNIWNIHFRVLKDFFDHEGVRLSPLADEPLPAGFSSGVGKILKFSENMVAIYNLKTRQVDQDLNLIHPLSKVVVYNMTHVFELLRQIDYSQVNLIQFDGDTLWLPAQQ